MAGRDPRRAEPPRVTRHHAELDLAVAEHVGVRRAALAVLVEEVREHVLAILAREVHAVQRHAEHLADAARVLEVTRGVAITVVFPVRHVQALHVVARIAQQQRRDGRVDAAGQRDDRGAAVRCSEPCCDAIRGKATRVVAIRPIEIVACRTWAGMSTLRTKTYVVARRSRRSQDRYGTRSNEYRAPAR